MNPLSVLLPLLLLSTATSTTTPSPAASVDCSTLVISMVDCLSYVSDNSTVKKPAGTCCTGLKSVLKSNPECICEAFRNSAQLGVSLNVTKAMTLPAACHVASPNLDNCRVSHGTVAPAMSPKGAMSPKASAGRPTTSAGAIKFAPAPSPKKSSASGLTMSIGSLLALAVVLISFT